MDLPDFYDPTYSNPFQSYFRCDFLDAVNHHAPIVLKSLREDVWERAKRDPNASTPPPPSRNELMARWKADKLFKEFNLPDWVGYYAEVAMNLWSGDSSCLKYSGWPSVSRGWAYKESIPTEKCKLPLPHFYWNVCGEPWSAFEMRSMDSLVQNSFSPISFWTGSERPEHPPPDRLATGSPHSAMFEQLSWLGSRLRASWRPGQDACTVADLVF